MNPLQIRHRQNATPIGALDRSAFGELLRGFRLRAGLSQEQLAEHAGISSIAISALERGVRRMPYRTTVALLAEALDLSNPDRSLLETAVDRPRRPAPGTHGFDAAAGVARYNLPLALTPFLGREPQLAAVAALLETNRLVTLTGSGGVGKTRVALHVGATLLKTLADGACLIDLTPLSDAKIVTATVARALRIEERTDRPLLETVIEVLSHQTMLLILDNCEHVVAEAARIAQALLAHAPYLRILATSRDPLRIAGEQTYRLPSMNVPSAIEARTSSAAQAVEYDACNLFVERARGADHRFALTDANAPAVAEICRRLDGIPLAIELAAARVNMLAPDKIAENLDRRFELLTGGNRDSPARHQTMRALLDWSFDLLTRDERLVFVRLSIFAGGCTLALATSVCSGDGIEKAEVFALLASLVEKSLLIADLWDSAPRYRLLESSRAYAREKLRHYDADSSLAGRHAAALLGVAENLEVAYACGSDAMWQIETRAEIDNWRAALEWSLISRFDVVLGQRLVGTLYPLWFQFLPQEGRRWVDIARETCLGKTDQSVLPLLDLSESFCAARVRDYAVALPLAERSLKGLTGARSAQAQYVRLRTMVRLERSGEAEPLLREALLSAVSMKATRLVGMFQGALSRARFCEGDSVTARTHASEACAAFTKSKDVRGVAIAIRDLSEIEFIEGDLQAALRLINDSIAVSATVDDIDLWANLITTKSTYLIALGYYDEARSIAREALAVSNRRQQPACVAFALNNLASIAALSADRSQGDLSTQLSRAARTFGFADSYYGASCYGKREPVDRRVHDVIYSALRSAMQEVDLRHFMTVGAQQTEDEAVREALLI